MKPLRLYLLIFSDEGCVSTVYQDIDILIKTWELYSGRQDVTGVVHAGYGRPQTTSFENNLERYRGRMLLTASAKWVCLSMCKCTHQILFTVEGIPVHLALDGWGYQISPEEISQYCFGLPEITEISGSPQVQHADADESESEILHRSPKNIIRSYPSWLLSVSIGDLQLRVRTFNALKNSNIVVVGDLINVTQSELMEIPNFGLTSLRDLSQQLEWATKLGSSNFFQSTTEYVLPSRSTHSNHIANNATTVLNSSYSHIDNLPDVIAAVISSLEPRKATIVSALMAGQTLESVGNSLADQVSRERIRQIEEDCLEKIGRDSIWMEVLEKKLSKLLDDRKDSLPLSCLSILDIWFTGIEKMRKPFQYLLAHENILNNRFSLLKINDQWLVTKILKDDWKKAVDQAVNLLGDNTKSGWTLAVAQSNVDALLGIKGRELSMELWAEASSDAHFISVSPGDEPILVSYGKGIKELVVAVLSESQAPLHYKEITRLINEKYSRNSSESTVQNAAANVGVILERGIYGLPKRISLNPDQQLQIHASVLEVMRKNIVIERQWHFDELFKLLKPKFGNDLDIKVLDLALKQCKQIKYLGREVWMLADADPTGNTKRIDIHQAVVSMLEKSGKPLSNSALKESISIYRGFGDNFQIHIKGSLISLTGKMWGIAGRDD